MSILIENFWFRLHPVLERLADKVVESNAGLTYAVGRSENDTFLLRAYLSFCTHGDGDEIAITVDVKADHNLLTVISDICADDGFIVATGPSLSVACQAYQPGSSDELDAWFNEFEQFLRDTEVQILKMASDLK